MALIRERRLVSLTRRGSQLINNVLLVVSATMCALMPGRASAGDIAGTVTSVTTASGLTVTVQIFNAAGSFQTSVSTTPGTGAYTVSGLPADTYFSRTTGGAALNYVDEAYNDLVCLSCSIAASTPISVAAIGTTTVNFALSPGGGITGNVTDAGTGTALSNVSVRVFSELGTQLLSALTNATGGYAIFGLPAGTYFVRTVVSTALNYVDEAYDNISCTPCNIAGTRPITVNVGAATAGINFGLSPGGSISGTITDAASTAILANQGVNIFSGLTGAFVRGTLSNASGVYTVSGLAPGTYVALSSIASGSNYQAMGYNNVSCVTGCFLGQLTQIPVTGTSTTSGINFALPPCGGVTGTVTDAGTSAPLSGVSVRVFNSSGLFIGSAATNASGVYVVAGLPAGAHCARTSVSSAVNYVNELYNNIPCLACSVTTGTLIAVAVGAVTSAINFALSPGGGITGTVTDASTGTPLGGVTVQVFSSTGAQLASVASNASGVYSFVGLAPGNYFVRTFVSAALNYVDEAYNNIPCVPCTITTTTPVAVVGTGTTAGINLALSPGATITGTIVDAGTGLPKANVIVTAFSSTGSSLKSSLGSNAAGVYVIKGLPAGTYYARSAFSAFFVTELYNNVPCPYNACAVTSGAPIVLGSGTTQSGINFTVTPNGPKDLVIDFGAGLGLWTLSPWGTFQLLHGLSPVATATGDLDGNGADDLVVNFGPGIGLYAWMNHATWVFLHPFSPTLLTTGDLNGDGRDDVMVVFPGSGVWRWAAGGWNQLHSFDASKLAVGRLDTGGGQELIVNFPGLGLYIFANNTAWFALHPSDASAVATADIDGSGLDDVIIVFPGAGIWASRNNSTWAQLHPFTPIHVATGRINGASRADVVVDFGPGIGLWRFGNNTTWSFVHGLSSQGFVLAERDGTTQDELVVNFGPGLGIWQFANNSTWSQLHPFVPESLGAGRLH